MKRKMISLTAVAALSMAMAGCTAVTIVPMSEETDSESGTDVAAFWDSQAIPEIEENAVETAEFLNEANGDIGALADTYGRYSNGTSGSLNFAVYGTGTIEEVNTEAQAGYITVSVEGYTGDTQISIQIGPVFKGTTMRDYLSFIDINDYSDQIAYAQVSQDINAYIGEEIVDYDAVSGAKGSTVEFYGCFTYSDDEEILITPSELELQ